MGQAVKVLTNLNEYERIVLVYKDENGIVHMAHSFFYNGRDGSEYLLFLYKDELPKGNIIDAWNYLDENSTNITIVGVHDHETAVEDFLCCWNPKLNWKDVDYYEVNDFSEVDDLYETIIIENNCAVGFGIRK